MHIFTSQGSEQDGKYNRNKVRMIRSSSAVMNAWEASRELMQAQSALYYGTCRI